MSHKQIEGEIKYRFSCLLLDCMLEDKIITKDEFILFKKKHIKKYKCFSWMLCLATKSLVCFLMCSNPLVVFPFSSHTTCPLLSLTVKTTSFGLIFTPLIIKKEAKKYNNCSFNLIKRKKADILISTMLNFNGAGYRTWTCMVAHQILSLACLPIPPIPRLFEQC